MFYAYPNNQMRFPPGYGGGITYSAAQSTVQAVQQAIQAQQQAQQSIQPYYYSSMGYYYPMHQITPYGMSISTIPYGTVYNL